MKKNLLFSLSLLFVCNIVLSQVEKNDKKLSTEELREKYSYFLRNHPFAKTKVTPKKERKAMELPPNAFYEQEWLYTADPALGRPTPEVALQLQMQLEQLEQSGRVPGDGMDNQWVERGPNNVGGRTRALMFAPGSTTKVFAGGVSGGLWVNNDITSTGSVWQQVNGVPANLAVSCITVDPNDSNIMYLGTGEVYTWGAVNGNGVYKSIDGGQNWRNIFGAAVNTNVRDNITYIQDIIAWNNPATNQTEVFFGADAMAYYDAVSGNPAWAWLGLNTIGLYRSTDGLNFTKLNNASLLDGSGRNYAPNSFDIGADGKLWMGTKRSYTYPITGGMLFSTTNGTSWNFVRDFGTNGRVEVACSKSNANKVYVLLQNYSTGFPVIRRSTDGFASNNVNVALPVSSGNQPPASNDFCRGQAFYDLMIGINPTNDEEVYVGGIEIFKTSSAFSSNTSGMWTQLTDWTVNPASSGGTPTLDGVHSDQHCIAFAPGQSSRVLFGNDGGIYYSNNSGTNIYVRNNGYNITQFYKAGINQTGTVKLLGGLQDNGSQLISPAPAGIGSASRVTGGDGCWEFIDKQNQFMVTSYVYNVYYFVNYTTNTATAYIANNTNDGDFVNQCGLDSDANILYANGTNGTTYRIYRYAINPSTGATTTSTLTNAALNDVPTYFEASPYTSNRVLVGLANGRLLRLNNANATPTWTQIGDGSWVGAISDIRYGTSDNEIYVTFHNYGTTSVWYTNNGGTSWQNKEGDLPNIPVKCILANPFATNEVIIGTELGVWYTTNFNTASPNWYRSNNGMKDVKVLSFDYRSSDNTILAATYGRGMFTGEFWQCGSTSTTWNGSTWSNGTPTKRVAAIINGNLSSTSNIEACSFTVNGTAQVTINSGHSLKVGESVTVAPTATLTIENNAALVQFSNTAVNSGNIIVKRNSTPMIRKDYTAWSSPVAGQQLLAFSPNTVSTRFYEYLYTGTTTPTAYQSVAPTNNFTSGKGYMIRVANNWSSSTPTVYNGQFSGVPNNGIYKTPVGVGYNLIGNPYPSPINANMVLLRNPKIDALYYWTHNVPQDGSYVAQTNYASYTILGGTAAIAGGATPNDYIQTGQGFFVEAREAVDFELGNEYRLDATVSTQFFKNSSLEDNAGFERSRIWLGLNGVDESKYNQILVGYMLGATNNADANIDGRTLQTEKTILYNIIDDESYVIQGRALPFNDNDVVRLGFNALEKGTYTINLDNVDGLFGDQNIYLKDNQLNYVHNIKEGPYTFLSNAGNFEKRFELVYKIPNKEDQIVDNKTLVFKNNNDLVLNSSNLKISNVIVYDIQGKKLFEKELNVKDYRIQNLTISNQAVIVKITLENKEEITKKIIF